MAAKIINLRLTAYAGRTDLKLRLLRADQIANGPSGTALTADDHGWFACTVSDAVTAGFYDVEVWSNAGEALATGGVIRFPGDAAGTYLVDDPDAATADIIDGVLDGLTSVTPEHTGPLNPADSKLTLTQRDTYTLAILRTQSWNVTSYVNALPSGKRTGLKWEFGATKTGAAQIKAFGDITQTGDQYYAKLELTKDQTNRPAGTWKWDIQLTTTDGEAITFDGGELVLEASHNE